MLSASPDPPAHEPAGAPTPDPWPYAEPLFGIFGRVWPEIENATGRAPSDAAQLSPFALGGAALEAAPEGALTGCIMAAPPGTIERRFALAHALRVIEPGGVLTAFAAKNRGGARLAAELTALGASVTEIAQRHARIVRCVRPLGGLGLADAIGDGSPRFMPELGAWTQPGVFSWNRLDPGAALLIACVRGAAVPLSGRGVDFGSGLGFLTAAALETERVRACIGFDLDRRAVACARANVADPRASFVQADLRQPVDASGLDFVLANPPFHDGGQEDRALGQTFIRRAASVLRTGGRLWLVANRGLPYEAVLSDAFARVSPVAVQHGYKVFEAVR